MRVHGLDDLGYGQKYTQVVDRYVVDAIHFSWNEDIARHLKLLVLLWCLWTIVFGVSALNIGQIQW